MHLGYELHLGLEVARVNVTTVIVTFVSFTVVALMVSTVITTAIVFAFPATIMVLAVPTTAVMPVDIPAGAARSDRSVRHDRDCHNQCQNISHMLFPFLFSLHFAKRPDGRPARV